MASSSFHQAHHSHPRTHLTSATSHRPDHPQAPQYDRLSNGLNPQRCPALDGGLVLRPSRDPGPDEIDCDNAEDLCDSGAFACDDIADYCDIGPADDSDLPDDYDWDE